jgi:hypothetical protein
MATATAGWVRGILGGVRGGIADGWCDGGFGLPGGAVGFSFACTILHVPSLHECNVVGPVLREILYT